MNLRQLETFVKIVEHRSFTKAAEELFLTQPTVSKQVVDLERSFGVKLIDRSKRSVSVTQAGELLLKYARDFLVLQAQAVDAMAAFKGLKQGAIRLGASTIPGVYILPSILTAFRQRYEGIALSLVISDTKEIISMVDAGALDMGFVGAKEEGRKVVYRRFLDDLIVLVGAADGPSVIGLDDLGNHPLVIREAGSGTRRCFEATLRRKGLVAADLRVAAEFGDTEAVKAGVKHGLGLGYLSYRAIREELAVGSLRVVDLKGLPGVRRSFYIVTRKGRSLSPQAEALSHLIDEWRKRDEVQMDNVLGGSAALRCQ